MIIKSQHINKMRNIEAASIYGVGSQLVRLEWITETGGTFVPSRNAYEGSTKVTNVLDNVAAIWGPVQRDQREKVSLQEQAMAIDQQGYWYFDNSLNLTGKPNLIILHRMMDELYSGDGTDASDVWTPDDDPSWTVNQWRGYWLVFAASRFKILSNDATSVTVDLNDGILPVGSTAGEILTFVKWDPDRDDLSNPGGSLSPIGQEDVFQSLLCTRLGIIGV